MGWDWDGGLVTWFSGRANHFLAMIIFEKRSRKRLTWGPRSIFKLRVLIVYSGHQPSGPQGPPVVLGPQVGDCCSKAFLKLAVANLWTSRTIGGWRLLVGLSHGTDLISFFNLLPLPLLNCCVFKDDLIVHLFGSGYKKLHYRWGVLKHLHTCPCIVKFVVISLSFCF